MANVPVKQFYYGYNDFYSESQMFAKSKKVNKQQIFDEIYGDSCTSNYIEMFDEQSVNTTNQ